MKLSQEFEELIDKKVEHAVDNAVREPWLNPRHIYSGLVTALLITIIAFTAKQSTALVCESGKIEFSFCEIEGE